MQKHVIKGSERENSTSRLFFSRRAALGLVFLVVFAALWFRLAGRWSWIQGWLFLLAFTVFSYSLTLWLARTNPALLKERNRRAENTEPWDKILIGFFNILFLALLVVAALDSGRFQWTTVPLVAQLAGWAGLCGAAVVVWHVMAVNSWLSAVVRIQEDREHAVVSKGLYGVVRHPMYVAVILSAFCIPLVLASLWALAPGFLAALLFLYRTAREDRTLKEKLTGYSDYAKRVRYRLLPGLW